MIRSELQTHHTTLRKPRSIEPPPSDAELVARVLGGDKTAYKVLITRHHKRILRSAYRFLGDWDDAEDAVQEACARAYQSLATCQDRDRFSHWLLQILINRCHNTSAAKTSRTRRERRWVRDTLFKDGTAGDSRTSEPLAGDDAGEDAERNCLRQAIERALQGIDPRYRQAFLLKHVDDFSYEEMVATTGDSISALKMRVSRACEMLRPLLASYQGEYHD